MLEKLFNTDKLKKKKKAGLGGEGRYVDIE